MRGEWANDPERELAEVALRLLDRQTAAKTSGDAAESARCELLFARCDRLGAGAGVSSRAEAAPPAVRLVRASGEA